VWRVDGAVIHAEVVQVGHRGSDGCPQTGYHLERLRAQLAQVATRNTPQHQPVRLVTALYPDQLNDARMGQPSQQGGFGCELSALLEAVGSLDYQAGRNIMDKIHKP
jgi:hypothetical protein